MNREMTSCELCCIQANAYCESDCASLCWNCDAKVHGANFLVARHSRTLLCHSCQSHTPWKACGARLGNTVSICESCTGGTEEEEGEAVTDDDVSTGTELEEEEEDDDDADDEDNEQDEDCDDAGEGDHQVVPLSRTSPLPPSTDSSSSPESAYRFNHDGDFSESVSSFSIKRMRENSSDLHLQENLRSSSETSCSIEWMNKSAVQCEELLRPLKDRRMKSSYRN